MKVPVLCSNCHALCHMRRFAFAWAIFCHYCGATEVKYDAIRLGDER